jgi:hypothetical protein
MTNTVLKQIRLAAEQGDIDEVTRLSPLLAQAREIVDQKNALALREQNLRRQLESESGSSEAVSAVSPRIDSGGRLRGGLIVTGALPKLGEIRVEERTAAGTMAVFLQRIEAAFGTDVYAKLNSIRTARGPLVSKQPQLDFMNPRRRQVYAHHPLGTSGWYVITHSSTAEKVEHLHRVFRVVGISPGAYRVVTRDT